MEGSPLSLIVLKEKVSRAGRESGGRYVIRRKKNKDALIGTVKQQAGGGEKTRRTALYLIMLGRLRTEKVRVIRRGVCDS